MPFAAWLSGGMAFCCNGFPAVSPPSPGSRMTRFERFCDGTLLLSLAALQQCGARSVKDFNPGLVRRATRPAGVDDPARRVAHGRNKVMFWR